MGNVLHILQLTRAARANDGHGVESVSSVLQLVEQRPGLLRAKSGALGGTLWHWAAENGNVLLLEELIRFVIRTTAAAAVQHQLCQLINQGFNLDTTPLMLACQHGHAEAVRTLLQHGADPQRYDRRGNNTCLHIAAYAGQASVIRVILNTQATYPLLQQAGVQLGNAPANPQYQQQEHQQQEHQQQEHQQQEHQQHPVVQQEPGTSSMLLDKGNLYGLTALHTAVCMGRAEAAQALLEAGASLVSRSRYPAQVGGVDLPHRSTPLHAAVHARDMQCVMLLLVAHEQQYGGTAAGRASDPRWLADGNERLPCQLARHMQLPDTLCELLHPLTPLREHLQQRQQQGVLVQQPGLPVQQRLCSSLQELAGAALRELLLNQLHCVAAAIGARFEEDEQQQPEAVNSAEELNTAAAELLMRLQDSVMVCINITHTESMCVQLATEHNRQQAADVKQLPHALQLSQQSLLDVVRFYILCHGVCDPAEPSSCWFAEACHICTAAAVSAGGTAPGNSLLSNNNMQHGTACRNLARDPLTESVDKACSNLIPTDNCCPGVTESEHCGKCGSSNGMPTAECRSWSLQDLRCSFMPPGQCRQLPEAALLDHSKLVPLLQSMKSSCAARWSVLQGGGSWREACGICLEEEQGLLLRLKPCKHVLCLSCVKVLVGLISSTPALCPFCRGAIAGVFVHVGEQGQGGAGQQEDVASHS